MISILAREDYEDPIAEGPAAGFLPKPERSARTIRRILGYSG